MICDVVGFEQFRLPDGSNYLAPTATPAPSVITPSGRVIQDTPDDCVVLDNAAIIARGGIMWRRKWCADEFHYMPPDWRDANWLPGQMEHRTSTITLHPDVMSQTFFDARPLFFIDNFVGARNFGHFIHDTIAYAAIFRRLRVEIPGLTPLLLPLPFPNQRQIFEALFELPMSACLLNTRPFIASRLYVPRRQTRLSGDIWNMAHRGLRDAAARLRDRWAGDIVPGPTKIYLHRTQDVAALQAQGSLHGRDFYNVAELCHRLADAGVVIFEPGKLPVNVIAPLLALASQVTAIHGAGLANLVFCASGTNILEITSHGGAWGSLEAVATVLGLPFRSQRQPVPQAGQPPAIDVMEVLRAAAIPA
jgi:hypothetical protein